MAVVNALPFCKLNDSCAIPSGKKAGDVCCGWLEFEKNGAPLQTPSKCLVIADFEKYYEDAKKDSNMENIAVGCKEYILEEWVLNNLAYSGPEESSARYTYGIFVSLIMTTTAMLLY